MGVQKLFEQASRMDKLGVTLTRAGLIVVLVWIGGLKAFRYEADGIVPFVANSPAMSFFYADAAHYKSHMNPEGAVVPANLAWHEMNQTYPFAIGLMAPNCKIARRIHNTIFHAPVFKDSFCPLGCVPFTNAAEAYSHAFVL